MACIANSAPAGAFYRNIFDGGKQNLHLHARQFPYQPNSAILPPIFTSKYTERIDVATNKPMPRADLTKPTTKQSLKERERYDGLVTNQCGNEAEKVVFENLNALVHKNPPDALLVLFNFEINLPKLEALSCDVRNITKKLKGFVKKNGPEFQVDFVILVRNVCIFLIEVKHTVNTQSITKSTRQLGRACSFFRIIAEYIDCNGAFSYGQYIVL